MIPTVQTNLQTISSTQYLFTLPSAPPFNHLVVFLLPDTALPPTTAAAVYIQFAPSPNQPAGASTSTSVPAAFKLLGAIANEKPSAIFKINHPQHAAAQATPAAAAGLGADDVMLDDDAAPPANGPPAAGSAGRPMPVTLGISIEPVAQVSAQLAALPGPATSASGGAAPRDGGALVWRPPPTKVLAQRIIRDAFNFLAGFASGDVVPLKSFQDWWAKFEKRLDVDPAFLERDEETS